MAHINDRCRPYSVSLNREFSIEPQTILIQPFLLLHNVFKLVEKVNYRLVILGNITSP